MRKPKLNPNIVWDQFQSAILALDKARGICEFMASTYPAGAIEVEKATNRLTRRMQEVNEARAKWEATKAESDVDVR